VPSEFGIFGYLLRIPLSTVTSDTCIQSLKQDYKCGAHRLPLFPLCPVGLAGLVRAVVATGAGATEVLADTTGATGAALTTDATEAALLTTGATGAALTAAALVASVGTAGTALVATDEAAGTAGTAEVTAGTAGTLAAVAVLVVAPTPPGLMAARLAVS
jgi:hypothetical protein